MSETVGAIGRSTATVVDILGASERNNRRDSVGSALIFHDGRAAMLMEGSRADVDRLLARLAADRRHCHMQILTDRPIVQRRIMEPVRLNVLSAAQADDHLQGRRLDQVAAETLERLLSLDELRVSASAA